jgi:probable HAF family extracellular repeat protein
MGVSMRILSFIGAAAALLLLVACGPSSEEPLSPANPAMHGNGLSGHWSLVVDSVRDLGTLGGSWSEAHDINPSGTVVGTGENAGGYHRATMWSATYAVTDVGVLPGGSTSEAWGINNVGEFVGSSTAAGGSYAHAYRWTARTGMQDLGLNAKHLPGTYYDLITIESTARSINNLGAITGRAKLYVPPTGQVFSLPFLLQGGVAMALPAPDTSLRCFDGQGNAVNDGGQVAAAMSGPTECNGGFRLTSSTTEQVPDFDGPGYAGYNKALGIGPTGLVVGTGEYRQSSTIRYHAYRWAPGNLVDLHPARDTLFSSSAYDINTSGNIVGQEKWWTSGLAVPSYPFFWSQAVGMVLLPQLGSPRCGAPITGGIAYAINDQNTIVGASYTCSGQWHATLWKVHVVFTVT